MWISIEEAIKTLESKLKSVLEDVPNSAYEKIDKAKEFPLLSFMPDEEYKVLKTEILKLRRKVIDYFTKSDSNDRLLISNSLRKYECFGLVFVPNKDILDRVDDRKKYLLEILVTLSIQNLNDDIRNLIIYVNDLRRLSSSYGVEFDDLLKKVIPISSNLNNTYSVSMREFFERILNNEDIPVK